METFSIKFTMPESLTDSGKIKQIEDSKKSILLEGGIALQELLANHMRDLNAQRSKHGSNFYSPKKIKEPVVNEDTVSIPITLENANKALHDIIIRPVEAQSLAIPIHASAYGLSAKEYSQRYPKKLFRPKGKDYLAKNENGSLVVMYILKKSVHQPQDRSILPSDNEMNDTFMKAVSNAVKIILEN